MVFFWYLASKETGMSEFVIGIDGGGTSCRAAIADRSGKILGSARAGAANILSDPDGALSNVVLASLSAISDAGLDVELKDVAAVLGLAGANIDDTARSFEKRLPFCKSLVETDGYIALHGAFAGGDGIAAILGTGSVYITSHEGKVTYTGGWGFRVGDLGAGARLGQALLQECLLVYDGIHRGTSLTKAVLESFSGDPTRITAFAHKAVPGDFGRYAPQIFKAAEEGDTIAVAILRQAASYVDEALDVALATGENRICLLGGLAPFYPAWLAGRHQVRLVEAKGDALSGAVSLAVSSFVGEVQ